MGDQTKAIREPRIRVKVEKDGGEGGKVERTEWPISSPRYHCQPPLNSQKHSPLYIPERGESARAPPTRSPHLPLIIEPQISALYLAALTTFPKTEKTFTSAHSCYLELDSAIHRARKGGGIYGTPNEDDDFERLAVLPPPVTPTGRTPGPGSSGTTSSFLQGTLGPQHLPRGVIK